MQSLDGKKASQDTNIALKVTKSNNDILADFFFLNLNNCIASSIYPSHLKFFIQKIADLVTFTGEILDGKLHFWCSDSRIPVSH